MLYEVITRTNLPGVYALGDAAAFMNPVLGKALGVPLAGPANKQARRNNFV